MKMEPKELGVDLIQTITCYRPIGPQELDKLVQSDYKEWPARLPEQPIFYPVTNEQYTIEITRWNVKQFGAGYVTKFEVKKEFMDNYDIHTVGAHYHTEWWIPSEELDKLNANIVGKIEIIGKYES